MRFLVMLVLCLVVETAVAKPSDIEKQYCAALGSYAFAIGFNRASGVPKEQAFSVLVQQNKQIEPIIYGPITRLIDAFYQEDVIISSAEELMLIVSDVNDLCLEQF